MTFHVRQLPRCFDSIHDFGLKNLIVSGCSFTYNNNEHLCTWPFYLRDLGNFQEVLDCSLPGAGNAHILWSMQWAITVKEPDPKDSLVVIMWSGNDRDDLICDATNITDYPFRFDYSKSVSSGISGGSDEDSKGNVGSHEWPVRKLKSHRSRAIENFLYVSSLHSWLQTRGFRFVFLKHMNSLIPNRTLDFEIKNFLPQSVANKYSDMMDDVEDLYTWAVKTNQLMEDDFHPTPDGHLSWTKERLLPYLVALNTQ